MSAPYTGYNVAPAPINAESGSGANAGWYGAAFMSFTTQTFNNVNVTSNSVIIISPSALSGGNSTCPAILSQTAGSFSVRWTPLPSPCVVTYLVLNS